MEDIITSPEQLIVGKMYMFKKPVSSKLASESLSVIWTGSKGPHNRSDLEEYLVYLGYDEHSFFTYMKFLLPNGTIKRMSLIGLEYHNAIGIHLTEL